MTELVELRVFDEYANLVFDRHEGQLLESGIRKVVIRSDDPRVPDIVRIHEGLREEHKFLFAGSRIIRKYSDAELESAEILVLLISSVFEPAGEECGTIYDEQNSCPICGAGAQQLSELSLDLAKIPKSKDCAASIAAVERVVSQRFADLSREQELTGIKFSAVRPCAKFRRRTPFRTMNWYQLLVSSQPVDIAPTTRIGKIPFWELSPKCPLGHFTGRWPLSEINVNRSSWDGSDFFQSKQMFGVRRGLLRPFPVLFASQRSYAVLKNYKLKGVEFEVAHFS
jgi:hypothetical protein